MKKQLIMVGVTFLLLVGLSGCTYQRSSVEVPNKAPISSCSAYPTLGQVPLTVNFEGVGSDSDGFIQSYHWDFGDEETSTVKDPSHTFQKSGRYSVILTVIDDDGTTDSDVIEIIVEGDSNEPPTAALSADKANGFEPLTVYFTGNGTDKDGSIVLYNWDFGDGETSTEQNPTHTFSGEGTYTITLTVTDDGGSTDSSTITIVVKAKSKFDVGETVTGEDFEVTVKSAEKSDYYIWIGDYTYYEYEEYADEGNVFIIIDVKVKQIGSGSEYIYGGDFWLIDSEGNKYDYDYGTSKIDGGLEGTVLYQDLQVQGKILFEVPDDIGNLKVQFNLGTTWHPTLVEWNLNI